MAEDQATLTTPCLSFTTSLPHIPLTKIDLLVPLLPVISTSIDGVEPDPRPPSISDSLLAMRPLIS